MKVKLLPVLLLCTLLSACEKVDLSEILGTKEEGYQVRFSMDIITKSDFDTTTRAVKDISELATVVNFFVFNGEDKVRTISQKKGDADFGTITTSLPEGTYQIVAIAHSGTGNATATIPEKITFSNNKVTDTFSYCGDITITGKNQFSIQLERVVAMFRLRIEQEIPQDVTQLKFYYTGGSSTLDATTGFGCVSSRQTELRDVKDHAIGQVFEVYTFPHEMDDELNMTITALDAKGDTYQEKVLPSVAVTKNKITTYYGNFFLENAGSNNSLRLQADDAWTGEDEYKL